MFQLGPYSDSSSPKFRVLISLWFDFLISPCMCQRTILTFSNTFQSMSDSMVKNDIVFSPRSDDVSPLVNEANIFFNTIVLHDDKYTDLQESKDRMFQRVKYTQCPMQKNGYDCGIFAVACAFFHLSERVSLSAICFSQAYVRQARSILGFSFSTNGMCIKTTRDSYRQCFRMLRQESVDVVPVDSEMKMIIPLTSMFLTMRSTRKNPISFDCNFNVGSRQTPITFPTPPKVSPCNPDGNETTESDSSSPCASSSIVNPQDICNEESSPTLTTVDAQETSMLPYSVVDAIHDNTSGYDVNAMIDIMSCGNVDKNAMIDIMKELKFDSFKNLTDIDTTVDLYEQRNRKSFADL